MHGDRLSGAGGQLGKVGNATAAVCWAEDSVVAVAVMTATTRARVTRRHRRAMVADE